MRWFIIFLVFITSVSLKGQTYNTKTIIAKADSILRANVGDSIYQYYHFDNLSWYEYKNSKNKSHLKYLVESKNTKGNLVNADVRFDFDYPILKGICIKTSVLLDSSLNLKQSIFLKQIPDFIWKGKPCDFITNERAVAIAKDSMKYKGINEIKQYLDFDSKYERYIYMIYNILSKQTDALGHDSGEEEAFKIDAITGEILVHWKGWYGQLE
jgi:hypothetical protein